MVQVITFPDAESLVIDHLNDNMTEPVHGTVPNPRPDTFVTVTRTGGPKRNIVTDEPTLTVDSWAQTKATAHDLAQEARGLINSLLGQSLNGVPVKRVDELAGPAWFPDPLSDQPRYRQSFSIALRGTVSGS